MPIAQQIKCLSPKKITIKPKNGKLLLKNHYPIENFWNGKILTVGCGKCYFCRRKYATIGAQRCKLETITQNELGNYDNGFLTLTFEKEPIKTKQLKIGLYDLTTKFIKKLRNSTRYYKNGKRLQKKLKYVGVSEFGGKNGRAHIHMLLGNLAIKDLCFWKLNNKANEIFISEKITKLGGHGITAVEPLTKENAAYLYKYEAKNYLQKCQSGGIGLSFFNTHLKDILNEKQYQNRYFLKKYRELIGDYEFLKGLKFELKQKERYQPKKIDKNHYLKLRDFFNSIKSKYGKVRDF